MKIKKNINVLKMIKKIKWELSIGTYPGMLLGIRSYKNIKYNNHVLYLPLIDFCLTIYKK